MRNKPGILLSNDDGILSPGLWALARELKSIASVIVVAPDREQSAIGTAVTLRQPLRVQKIESPVSGVDAYSIEGTPGDSVILALEKLANTDIDIVISGINQGLNLGDDVFISGTVAAALQGYLRSLPSLAFSVAIFEESQLATASRLARLIVKGILSKSLPENLFLNINIPDSTTSQVKGIKVAQLAHKTHIDTADEGHDGRKEYYWLKRRKLTKQAAETTDIWALEQGYITVTELHISLFGKTPIVALDGFFNDIFRRLF